MTSLLPQYIEVLKTAVLEKSGFSTITPCDCKAISNLIYNQTKFSISETTLKRIYGFAYSKFKPSLFTINVMAKYCGYQGWDDFCHQQEQTPQTSATNNASWERLKINASKITNFTLQVLRNKAGIPYNLTIKRQHVNHHFDEFLAGDYTATLLAAPAGHGKTIALCHWLEERINLNAQGNSDDVILFFSTSALMSAFLSGRDLNQWLLALLGYSADENITALFDDQQKKGGDFFLVIDDLDEHNYKPEQFKLLLSQLTDIFSLYQSYPWFKLIVTMRSDTWINNRHDVDNGSNKWFKGFIGNANWATNVPLFSVQEIKELSHTINPGAKSGLSADIATDLNHPLYFQFYYKEHKDNFSLSDIDHVCIYELISTFILNKVYLGHYSAEKILLLKGLIERMDFVNQNYDVTKTSVNALIKQYPQAYNELTGVGFIRELNNSTDLQYQTNIEFSNHNFLEYAISKTLLQANNFVFDTHLIKAINTQFEESKHKLPVLKWCLLYAIRTDQQLGFDVLSQTKLSLKEKSDLIIFLGDMLDKQWASANRSESLTQYFKKDCSPALFNYFFGIEFINLNYKKTLHSLLKFGLSNRKRILVYTMLASSAVMRLDMNDLELYLAKLKAIPAEEYNRFAINPLKCLDTLYAFFKYGEFKKEVFAEITHFYFNPPKEGNYFEDNASNDMIYLLGAYTSLIAQAPLKTLRYINILEKNYKKINLQKIDSYTYFLGVVMGNCYFRLGQIQKTEELYAAFNTVYKRNNDSFTNYMKNMFYALRLKTNLLLKKYAHIIEDTTSHMQVAGENRLSKLFMLAIIINNKDIEEVYPQFHKQCLYEHGKLLRETNVTTILALKSTPAYNT
ncbi:hypothetical protein [Mucilaginibacter phyllosphaerae]|uniref:NACHT domain-containing protein n=1 Tax=Mucilaginibacter phyllosphaerae TaxID=1812349 RepID=A0A4Y8AHZ6_9SPHI|nr:hypothetical protein [Mucilaginibacter phyllosphaerae]MBB3968471.1 hypothetical protein [Mucilaginibacter phyllosphaerae]TEW67882.1 hypothetical protein E2R65_07810 [Mucilaginibacter phyllosphaerae]GGH15798.1 hypothetical protein GCM10007352_24790 [Mucilaginibacter phyllosphaerae]